MKDVDKNPMAGTKPAEFAATIYALCIDRYEHLDAILRSLPSPADRKAAEAEKAVVEAIVRTICNPLQFSMRARNDTQRCAIVPCPNQLLAARPPA